MLKLRNLFFGAFVGLLLTLAVQAQQTQAPAAAQMPSASESSESIEIGGVTLRLEMAQDYVIHALGEYYSVQEFGTATAAGSSWMAWTKGGPPYATVASVAFIGERLSSVYKYWTGVSEPDTEADFASTLYGAVTRLEQEGKTPCEVTTNSSQQPAGEVKVVFVTCTGRQKYLSIDVAPMGNGKQSVSLAEILEYPPDEMSALKEIAAAGAAGSVARSPSAPATLSSPPGQPGPSVIAPSSAQQGNHSLMEVRTEKLYAKCSYGRMGLHSADSLGSQIVGIVSCGDELTRIGVQDSYVKVRTEKGIEGYILDRFVSMKPETPDAAKFDDPSTLVTIKGRERLPDEQLVKITEHNRALCDQVITVAGLTPNGLALYVPPEGQKFMAKNSQDYPRMCLLEGANNVVPGVPRYLLVYAYSENAFAGFQPVTRINTTTTPVSGSGTVMNGYGSMWNFTYSGTVETSEMDTIEAPYVIRSRSLFLNAYDENGSLVSRHSFTVSSQLGGNGASAIGYNGAQLISMLWNNPSRLIKSVLEDVQKNSTKYSRN
jgi:hypothetical protein